MVYVQPVTDTKMDSPHYSYQSYADDYTTFAAHDGTNNEEIGLLDFFIFLAILTGVILMAVFFLALIYCVVKDLTVKLLRPFVRLSDLEDDEHGNTTQHPGDAQGKDGVIDPYNLDNYLDSQVDSKEVIEEKLKKLPLDDQFYYKQGEDYLKMNPPFLMNNEPDRTFNPIMTEQALQYVEEEGAKAWEFTQTCNTSLSASMGNDTSLPNDSLIITDKTDLQFLNNGYDISTWTNLPIPYKKRVYYYECKIFELNNDSNCTELNGLNKEIISIGLTTLPYPDFRLPGRHHHSVAYDSNGDKRMNNSFELPIEQIGSLPTYKKSDIIGVGYRCRSGTVFFTKNGKKIREYEFGHIKKWRPKYLYPCIGSNMACKLHVNFGSRGFVYIEANSKKWGYGNTNGMKLPPPAYDKVRDDFILEEGFSDDDYEDDEEDLSDEDWEEEEEHNGLLAINNLRLQKGSNKRRKKSFLKRGMDLLPPAPFFDFEKRENTTSVPVLSTDSYGDQISLKFMPPTVPPEYRSE